MSYTKGPWEARHGYTAICTQEKPYAMTVARVYWSEGRPDAENIANANLMATAPELLEEAKESLALIERIIEGKDWGAIEEIADGLRNVITKAQGEGV